MEQKASLMFFMLQDNGQVYLNQLETFGERIVAKRNDIDAVIKYSYNFTSNNIGLDDFVLMFKELYEKNEVFNWMKYVIKPYKELEEFKDNTNFKRQEIEEKKVTSLPKELQHLVFKDHFTEDIVKYLHLTHKNLKNNKRLTVEYLADVIKSYDIKDPLATNLANRSLLHSEISSEEFIKVFYLLTQENIIEQRCELLFSLYCKNNVISM